VSIWFEIVLLILAVTAAVWSALPTRRRLDRAGEHFGRRYRLWILPSDTRRVDRALRREFHGYAVGTIAAGSAYLVGRLFAEPLTMFWLSLGLQSVVVAGLRARAAGTEFPTVINEPLVARSRSVGLRDYLPTPVLGLLAANPLLAAGAALFAAFSSLPDQEARSVVVLGVVISVAEATIVGAAWALCRQPEPASSLPNLYLHDAWRARTLSAMAGFLSVVIIVLWSRALASSGDAIYLVLLALCLGLVVGSPSADPLHFRRRLWPDLASDEVVVVGNAEPSARPT
jgi:hypothetical protein